MQQRLFCIAYPKLYCLYLKDILLRFPIYYNLCTILELCHSSQFLRKCWFSFPTFYSKQTWDIEWSPDFDENWSSYLEKLNLEYYFIQDLVLRWLILPIILVSWPLGQTISVLLCWYWWFLRCCSKIGSSYSLLSFSSIWIDAA